MNFVLYMPRTGMKFQDHLISRPKFWPFSYLRHNFMDDSLAPCHPAGATMTQRAVVVAAREGTAPYSGMEQKVAPSYEHRLSTGCEEDMAAEVSREYCFSCARQEGSPSCGMPPPLQRVCKLCFFPSLERYSSGFW